MPKITVLKATIEFTEAEVQRAVDAGLDAVKKSQGASLYEIANEDVISRQHIEVLVRAALAKAGAK